MKTGHKILISVAILLVVVFLGLMIFFYGTPKGRELVNAWQYSLDKVDESNYENQKKVEDSCRAMIASYNSDKLIYEQYKDSESTEERGWANSAKIRANQTASTYNNYILKNSYVWKDNVPSDIKTELTYIT